MKAIEELIFKHKQAFMESVKRANTAVFENTGALQEISIFQKFLTDCIDDFQKIPKQPETDYETIKQAFDSARVKYEITVMYPNRKYITVLPELPEGSRGSDFHFKSGKLIDVV